MHDRKMFPTGSRLERTASVYNLLLQRRECLYVSMDRRYRPTCNICDHRSPRASLPCEAAN